MVLQFGNAVFFYGRIMQAEGVKKTCQKGE